MLDNLKEFLMGFNLKLSNYTNSWKFNKFCKSLKQLFKARRWLFISFAYLICTYLQMNWKFRDLNNIDKEIDNSLNSKKVIIEIVFWSLRTWLEILKFSIQVLIGLL